MRFYLSGTYLRQSFNILFYNVFKGDIVVGWAFGSGDFQSLYMI